MRKLQEAELDLQQGDGHILYVFQDTEKYINNALAFIKTGIKMGDYILVIENERITVKLNERLKACLSPEDWKDVSFVSNFEFYYISEDFHVPSIISTFARKLSPHLDQNRTVRTWAHVEWGARDDIASKVTSFEHLADEGVREMKVVSVCAYNERDICERLEEKLCTSHQFKMTDDEMKRSPIYLRK